MILFDADMYVKVRHRLVSVTVQRGGGANERSMAHREAKSRLMRCKIKEV